MPGRLLSQSLPVKARSVPFSLATRYCSGVSFARHSSSLFTILPSMVSTILISPQERGEEQLE